MMSKMKDDLIREVFEMERDIAYRSFRKFHWNLPEIVGACPNPAVREEMLRGFWNRDAEKHFPQFYSKVAGMNFNRLLDLRADLVEQADAIACLEYRELLAEAAIRPANDNERELER
jgi:hypothetical protein